MQDKSGKGAAVGGDAAAAAQNPVHLNGHSTPSNGYSQGITPTPQQPSDSSAPFPGPPPAAVVERDQWGGKYEFLLSCIGYCVGLGNVWRFPYLCYRNGGGVFLIPYFIMLFVTGVPLFLMELSLGQYGSAGPIMVWKCCPLLKGIGIGMLCVSTLVCLYYNVIIAWTFYYLGSSFQSPLPWSCDALSNALICGNGTVGNSSMEGRHSPTEIFWNEKVLGVVNSEGLHDPGPVRWPLALCLLAAWIIIFLCMLKGIRSSGKVVYVTATFPYFVLIVLIIRGATLEGSLQGVAFYLTPDWSRLANAQVWNDAASQIFYSLGIGVGGLLSMASYNKFDNNVIRDTIVITVGNCSTSFFAGFAIFSILGHMAWRKGVPVGKVADTGPGLAFVAYPEALALLPGSVFWSIMFFLMLFMLGVDTLFGNMEGITTAVLDEFPNLRRNTFHKALFLGTLCFVFYLMGLLLVTDFILIYIFLEMYNTPLQYGSYVYPRWGKGLGVCMGATCCLQIPIWAIVAISRETGSLKERFKKSIRPLNSWRVNNSNRAAISEEQVEPEQVEAPYTVTLTDMDFTAMTWEMGSDA
ncbi:sodium-dependent proline transporter isoform X2 [Cyprinodon tularosa]|uniref:sodium-dependent proline transporter isoform X2 n=1 Tax=Cyprinodon tularosa TaxID=77115 RepID=UPI0018E20621|nr:sodium-dependent proline transporter isoform X2 [Cyprinodon tularosa]